MTADTRATKFSIATSSFLTGTMTDKIGAAGMARHSVDFGGATKKAGAEEGT
jgi:hypothetical protein